MILQRDNSKNIGFDIEVFNELDFLDYVKYVNGLCNDYDLMSVYNTFEPTILKISGFALSDLIKLIKSLNPEVLDKYFSQIFDNFL